MACCICKVSSSRGLQRWRDSNVAWFQTESASCLDRITVALDDSCCNIVCEEGVRTQFVATSIVCQAHIHHELFS